MEFFEEFRNTSAVVVLIGNKNDLAIKREVESDPIKVYIYIHICIYKKVKIVVYCILLAIVCLPLKL